MDRANDRHAAFRAARSELNDPSYFVGVRAGAGSCGLTRVTAPLR
jgi:hypothetical protein